MLLIFFFLHEKIVTFFFHTVPLYLSYTHMRNAALKLHKSLSRFSPSASLPGDGADVKTGTEEDGGYFRLVRVAVWRGAGAAAGSL